ncbi:hypothetical protein EV127DRAFT_88803 [Xylaria flabelliformis]|nr:hypothetical protein EV127DRAFT_88803 [Xylaria flabelliformis]
MANLGLLPESAGYIAALSVLAAVATLAVSLRFWVTSVIRAGLHPDDWLSLVTIIAGHGLSATLFLAFVSYGLGHSTAELAQADSSVIIGLQKISFTASLLYATGSLAVKLAVIGFYFRIFPTCATRWGCYVLSAICAVWFLVAVIVSFAACRHLGSGWDPTINGYCIDATNYPIALGGLNVIVDFATVALPIYEVLKLRLAKRKKYTVAGIFVIGGIATAASLARFIGLLFTLNPSPTIDLTRKCFIKLYSTLNLTYHRVAKPSSKELSSLLSVLGIIEVYVGLIGACVPTLGPIYDKFRRGQSISRTGGNSKSSERQSKTYMKTLGRTTSRSCLRNEDDVEGSSERLEGASISSATVETMSHWTDMSRIAGANPAEDIPMRTIHIQRGKNVF